MVLGHSDDVSSVILARHCI